MGMNFETECCRHRINPDEVPIVEQLHVKILEALANGEGVLDMSVWHGESTYVPPSCSTTHCRAGWTVHLAGPAGYALEDKVRTPIAAKLILLKSCPYLDLDPLELQCLWHTIEDEALEHIEECASIEMGMSQ